MTRERDLPAETRDEVDDLVEEGEQLVLSDLINRVLDKGVVISSQITISVADVDLIEVGLKLMLASTRTADAWRLTTAQRAAGPPGERR